MRTLLLMRHAKSSHESEQLSDHDRPLDQRGRLDATRMGRFLIERNIVPQGFVSSTAVRARETAQLVMKGANQRGEPDLKAELYMAEPLAYVQVLSQLLFDSQRVMVVGYAEKNKKPLNEISLAELRAIDRQFSDDAQDVFNLKSAMERRKITGAPGTAEVRKQLTRWIKLLK